MAAITRNQVEQYLCSATSEFFGCTFGLDEEINEHIADHDVEWFEIISRGEAKLLGGEQLPDDTLERVSTLNDIADLYMKVLNNKTRIVSAV